MTTIEAAVRQMFIYVSEVYDATGNHVMSMRAWAQMDDREICHVDSDGRIETPEQLGQLLSKLGARIGQAACRKDF